MSEKITFADIEQANKSIKTIGIDRKNKKTGQIEVKNYAEVNERLKAFRMVYPEGGIVTEVLSVTSEECIIRAEVHSPEGFVLGTGTAREVKNASYINKTSYVENCETSAIGRALGACGFGIDYGLSSYEEVANAQRQQEEAANAQQTWRERTIAFLKSRGVDLKDLSAVKAVLPQSCSSIPIDHATTEEQWRFIYEALTT